MARTNMKIKSKIAKQPKKGIRLDNIRQMSLKEAYKIVLNTHSNSFSNNAQKQFMVKRALQLIAKKDSDVANRIYSLIGDEVSIKSLSVFEMENLLDQLSTYLSPIVRAEVKEKTLQDEEVRNAFKNTVVTDDKGNPVDSQNIQNLTFDTSYAEAIIDSIEKPAKTSSFIQRVKQRVLRNIAEIRVNSLDNENFETKVRDVFNFKKKFNVGLSHVNDWFSRKQAQTEIRIDNLKKQYQVAKPKIRAQFNKVAVFAVALFTTSTVLLSSCTNKSQQRAPQSSIETVVRDTTNNDTVPTVSPVVKNQQVTDTIPATQPAVEVQQVTDTVRIVAPTEWNDSMSISRVAFRSTVDFCNGTFGTKAQENGFTGENAGFEYAYSCLTNDVMENHFSGADRETVLNAYRYSRSMWQNPNVKGLSESAVNAGNAAIAFEKFINCDDQLPDDVNNMVVNQEMGTLAKYAVRVDDPCGDAKVVYKTLNSTSKQSTAVTEENVVVTDTITTDTVTTEFNYQYSASLSVEADTVYTKADSVNISVYKGNNLQDGRQSGTITLEEALKLNADDTTVMAQMGEGNTRANADSTEVRSQQFNFASSSNFEAKKDSVAHDEAVAHNDTVSTEVRSQQFNFASSSNFEAKKDSVIADSIVSTPNDVVENTVSSVVEQKDSIVVGTEGVKIGTPSAGNHQKRGGVDGSGLTAEQINHVYQKFGKEKAEEIMENIPEEWMQRGGIVEGLSRAEAVYCFSVMAVTAPNSPEARAVLDYTIGCHQGEVMEQGLSGRVQRVVAGIHINKTRDDMAYTKGIYVNSVTYNGCDEGVSVDSQSAEGGRVTASGPYFDRMFRIPVAPQPAFGFSYCATFEEHTDVVYTQPDVTDVEVYKGNNLGDGRHVKDMPVDDVLNLNVGSEKVMAKGVVPSSDATIFKGNNLTDGKVVGATTDEQLTQATGKKKKACYVRKAKEKQRKRAEKQNSFNLAGLRSTRSNG